MKPTPKPHGTQYVVDLRWAGFGQRYVLCPLTHGEAAAIHAAYDLLARLRRDAAQRALELPGLDARPARPLDAALWSAYLDQHEEGSPDSRRYVAQYVRMMQRLCAGRTIRDLEPPQGHGFVRHLRDELRARGGMRGGPLAAKSANNALNQLAQFCRWLRSQELLVSLPDFPRATRPGEKLRNPTWGYYTESDFRRVRDSLWDDDSILATIARNLHLPSLAAADDHRARRRLYLSFSFYTGMRPSDLDALTADDVYPDARCYIRRGRKTDAEPETFDMPEQLAIDVDLELARLGRPWRNGELICGGPWAKGVTCLGTVTRRLGLPPLTFRLCRKSTAREYCLRGWPKEEVASILGHADTTMLDLVYLKIPVRLRSPVKVPWSVAPLKAAPIERTASAVILPFRAVS